MKNKLPKICYWCGIELTKDENKREHVPPLGFFPKGYRNNLIRVPSCEKHNNNFSALDEKFQFYLKAQKSNSPPPKFGQQIIKVKFDFVCFEGSRRQPST